MALCNIQRNARFLNVSCHNECLYIIVTEMIQMLIIHLHSGPPCVPFSMGRNLQEECNGVDDDIPNLTFLADSS